LSVSAWLATFANPARFSTARQQRRLSPPNGLMNMAVSDSTTIGQRLSDATAMNIRKLKRFLRLAGLRCPTFLCEFLTIFEYLFFFRRISGHSLVGLDNGAMLLLGGIDWGSGSYQTGIWQLKREVWSRIGELSKVWNIIKKNLILVFQPAYYGSAIYVSGSVYYFEYWNSAIHRLDLDNNEELEAVEEIRRQPKGYSIPVLFQADNDYCTWTSAFLLFSILSDLIFSNKFFFSNTAFFYS
jgi:hypothetical protein